jgi:creatinine amidohydrolase
MDCTEKEVRMWLEKTDIALVPVGSCEQHGPHLPLMCDSISAWEIARRAAKKADVPHTPLVWTGYSPHHMGTAGMGRGTITVRASTFVNLLSDIGKSLIHHGFNKIIYVNGHGSNFKVIEPVIRRIRYETGALAAVYKAFAERDITLVRDLLENPMSEAPGWHASEIETSQCMAYDPNLVHMEWAVKEFVRAPAWMSDKFSKIDGSATVAYEGFEGLFMANDHHEYSRSGVVGNPFRASKEKGDKIFERFANNLAGIINELKKVEVKVHTRDFFERGR